MIRCEWLGRLTYGAGLERMEAARCAVQGGAPGMVLLLEHDPVISLGRSADRRNIHLSSRELAERGIEVVETRRGGDVTYHGPGQLVIYPIVRVRKVLALMEAVAAGVADVAEHSGVSGAEWRRDPAGVWLGARKLAACGIHVSRGVSGHGFALNVTTPASAWRALAPCGLSASIMTSLRDSGGQNLSVPSVAQIAAQCIPEALSRAAQQALR